MISPSLLRLDNEEEYCELDLQSILGKTYKRHVIFYLNKMMMFKKTIGEKDFYFFKDYIVS